VTAREGWNRHGHWIGDPGNEPTTGRPPKARCGGPHLCPQCSSEVVTFAQFGEHQHRPCSFCKQPIIWTQEVPSPRAKNSRKVPLDAEPNDTTVWTITPNPGDLPWLGEMRRNQAAGYRATGGKTYQKHVKTCTRVKDWPKGQYLVKQGKGSQ
jgi:hypothetical protein